MVPPNPLSPSAPIRVHIEQENGEVEGALMGTKEDGGEVHMEDHNIPKSNVVVEGPVKVR